MFIYLCSNIEDGGVTLNGAKVVKSFEFADATKTGIVHEVDGFISPSILWRYADQREFLLSSNMSILERVVLNFSLCMHHNEKHASSNPRVALKIPWGAGDGREGCGIGFGSGKKTRILIM